MRVTSNAAIGVSDFPTLVTTLRARIGGTPAAIIGIEGHSTSGKTTLATDLALACGGERISTDMYVDRQSDALAYSDRIFSEKLLTDLARLRREKTVVFIEGICLRDTLRLVGIAPESFIYCKRITQAGLWADDPLNYVDAHGRPQSTLSTVDGMSVEYHLRVFPLEKADIVYLRQET
jgi:hypothetical protein